MKLDHKRTVLVGLAFFSICAFWQMYDNIIPLILTHTFQLDETVCGAIMAADNVLALFLLPFFGALSDRTSTRIGRRMPFILGGTACAVVLMNLLPLFDNGYAATGEKGKLVLFVVALGLLLVAMGTYRSPAVALMPDVTPKPLRSRANAIINLMGAVGGITYLLTAALLYPNSKTAGVQHVNYQPLFVAVSLLMAAAVAVLYFTTNEPKLAAAEKEYEAEHPEQQLVEEEPDGSEELPKEVKRSLVMLLNSIALWYIGYNGVTTWWTTYVARVMGQGLGGASTCLLVATGGAIVSYIPVGQLASRIGRKKTIQGGVLLLAACFLSGYFLTTHYQRITGVMFIVFALVGLAWAAINVNSLPMVVEMCKGSDIGKFTGYYYTFSMAAQVVTPILAGTLLKHISYSVLFPYASFFVACSFVTMCFVRHGDCKVEAKGGLAAYEDMDAD
ncbi:MAG: MFS transporter [Oscillibacter sp.]|nr:MFS transporter [Oscillibacter sp.]